MVVVDTSVWIDHLRRSDRALLVLLSQERVLAHPFVIGEIAMGSLKERARVVAELGRLQQAKVATHDEAMKLVETRCLFGLGLSYVDAHLIASTLVTPGARLWTRDRRLHDAAKRLDVAGPG